MSAPSLSTEVQLRYLLQWFSEFSELQREDFLPVLAAAQGEKYDQLAAALAALNYEDKPVSLFQCRVKLFNDWYPTWSEEERFRLMKGVTEMDSDFAKKVQECNIPNGTKVNGIEEEKDIIENGDVIEHVREAVIEPVQEVEDKDVEQKDEVIKDEVQNELVIDDEVKGDDLENNEIEKDVDQNKDEVDPVEKDKVEDENKV